MLDLCPKLNLCPKQLWLHRHRPFFNSSKPSTNIVPSSTSVSEKSSETIPLLSVCVDLSLRLLAAPSSSSQLLRRLLFIVDMVWAYYIMSGICPGHGWCYLVLFGCTCNAIFLAR
ncbi:hypothetical protein RIF29_29883 [Crotalaria pallida]|uniref:Uncharacterized protein n=1 Tax=Crotalaria pallida TaxID=3830 RepID=A0AAN9EFL1_CROPI